MRVLRLVLAAGLVLVRSVLGNGFLRRVTADDIPQIGFLFSQFSIYGTPFVAIGRTAHLAWTHTAPTGSKTVVTKKVYRSRHGPALADGWTSTHATRNRYQAHSAEIELDGSTSDCAWGGDRDPAASITALPAISGSAGTKRPARTQLGLERIQQQLPSRFTLANLQELLTHERNRTADRGRDSVVSLCWAESVLTSSNGTRVDVSKACAALTAWSGCDGVDDRGAVLWREFWLCTGKVPDLWSVPFGPGRPVDTPNTVNIARDSVRQALADAVLRLSQLGVPVDAPLSAARCTTVGGGPQPVSGCGNVEGCHDITAATDSGLLGEDGRFGAVTTGSSFVMAVRLTRDGPVARTLRTYSESTDAASPHHGDRTALYGSGKWVVEADVVADPQLSLSVLCGRGA
jgi:acyl-homoserine-lactone acylase